MNQRDEYSEPLLTCRKSEVTSKLDLVQESKINLQGIWLLCRWCSAYKWRESDLGFCGELREPVVLMLREKFK